MAGTVVGGTHSGEGAGVEIPPPFEIVGRWICSFHAFTPGDKLPGEHWKPLVWVVNQIAPLIPAYSPVLMCFAFKKDGSFQIDRQAGHSEHPFSANTITGNYSLYWKAGVPGGDIVARFANGKSATWKFLMNSENELHFIAAHGTTPEEVGGLAAGVMRRALIIEPEIER